MGKVAAQYECATSSCPAWPTWGLFYNYNLIGGLTSYTNGAGTTFTQTFNVGGRVTSVTSSWSDSQHPASLATGIHYNAVGGLEIETLGNGLTNTVAYNGRLQPCRNNVNSAGTLLVTCGDPIPSGNKLDLTVGYGSGDNGNVMAWSAVGAQTFTRSYSPYDGVNRLTTMTDTATGAACTGLSWSYDAWGNRQQNIVSGSSCNHWNALYNSNNQISSVGSTTYTYDAAGNLTYDGSHSYSYDAENRLISVDGGSTATYVYDAEGRRVSKTAGGATTGYVYDAMGQILTDVNGATLLTAYVPLNGQLLALYTGGTGGTTEFAHQDHLGSTRLLTSLSQCVVDNLDYFPFGELNPYSPTCPLVDTTHKFTGKERDPESNLDNFEARYYSSAQGRMMSPDPMGGHLEDPQTLNRYSYVRNNPLILTDPTGLDFNLNCDKDNGTTCQGGRVYYQDQKGNYQPTVVKSDKDGNLTDQSNNKYSGTFDGKNVSFTNANGTTFGGSWIQGSNDTSGIKGGGDLSDKFSFTFSDHGNGQTLNATFNYAGSVGDAIQELQKAGYNYSLADQVFNLREAIAHPNAFNFRTPGDLSTGKDSGHALLNMPWFTLNPLNTVPAVGSIHTGETNPTASFEATWQHLTHEQ
jgi:RHS repeat-associated protein